MTRADRIALLLSLAAALLSYLVASVVFEKMAHIEDEFTYVWQAQAMARGKLSLPSPPRPNSFLVPFVVDLHGQRFGKYPPGWPAALAVGVALGARAWVNPLLAGLAVWLTYRLGKRLFSETVGLLAAGLTLTSPFFLMNSGSLLSHPFGLFLSLAFVLAWLDAFWEDASPHPWPAAITAALCLGLLALTRPLTAVAVGAPFALHGLYRLVTTRSRNVRLRLLAAASVIALLGGLVFAWQFAMTGDPFLNPYTLWWDYDKIGFGPGIGVLEGGHNLGQAITNTRHSLRAGVHDLFGWPYLSWIFLPFGLWAARRNGRALMAASVFPSLVLFYMLYWIGSWLFGPRYYYEGLFSLTLTSAAGIAWLAGWPLRPGVDWAAFTGRMRWRPLAVTAVVALLVTGNLLFYAPTRVGGMHNLYTISRARLAPFLTPQAQALTPALVVVHPQRWMPYGALLELSDPFLDTPFVFVISRGAEADREVESYFPQRRVIHYYPDEPGVFYFSPKE